MSSCPADTGDLAVKLRFAAKQLERDAKKSEKESNKTKQKVRKALAAGDKEAARIYAETAVQQRHESLNFLRLGARLDTTSSKLKSMQTMNRITAGVGKLSQSLDLALKSMDSAKLTSVLDRFEANFEKLDVNTAILDSAMSSSQAAVHQDDEVEKMMNEIADASGLEVANSLPNAEAIVRGQQLPQVEKFQADSGKSELEVRMSKLLG